MSEVEAEIAAAAGRIMDVWMGGDTTWRERMDKSLMLESEDWAQAMRLARAALHGHVPEYATAAYQNMQWRMNKAEIALGDALRENAELKRTPPPLVVQASDRSMDLIGEVTDLFHDAINEHGAQGYGRDNPARFNFTEVVGKLQRDVTAAIDAALSRTHLPTTEVCQRLGSWLSAALDDPNAGEAFKADIRAWFEAGGDRMGSASVGVSRAAREMSPEDALADHPLNTSGVVSHDGASDDTQGLREMSPEDALERVARAIADGLGDDFDDAHESKSDWITQRGDGLVTGRFRDVNEPRKPDYLEAARAALQAIQGPSS